MKFKCSWNVLSTVNHRKFTEIYGDYSNVMQCSESHIYVGLLFGEATIHQAHSGLQQSYNIHVSFAFFVGLFPLVIAFKLLPPFLQGMALHSHLHYSLLALVDKSSNFPVFLVASIMFGFTKAKQNSNLIYWHLSTVLQ